MGAEMFWAHVMSAVAEGVRALELRLRALALQAADRVERWLGELEVILDANTPPES